MRALDLKGQSFGELTALVCETIGKKRGWICQCSCGNSTWVPTHQLNSGNNKTCGASSHKQSIKIGNRFGKLVVRRIHRDAKNRRYMAQCVCDCGGIKQNTSFKDLQRGSATHCGCSRDVSRLGKEEGVSALNALIASYKNNARKRGLSFDLTREDCLKLFKGDCYLCGKAPSDIWKKKGLKGSITFSGIDRVDSADGYVLSNARSCCTMCNYLKSNHDKNAFLNHIQQICIRNPDL